MVINLEKKLWEMEGLEDLYSQARDGFAIVTAKFKVGENLETSLFKVYNKVFSNIDQVPSGVAGWVVKPMSINDVPIVTLTLYSNAADDYQLRRVADELLHRLQSIPDTGRSYVVAGRKRQVRVVADPGPPGRASAWTWPPWPRPSRSATSICPRAASPARTGNTWWRPGRSSNPPTRWPTSWWASTRASRSISRTWPRSSTAPKSRWSSAPSPSAPRTNSPRATSGASFYPAVTMAVAKRTGTNAVTVAQGIIDKLNALKA